MTPPAPRRSPVLDALGHPWVFWGLGAVIVGSSFAAKQGASWWIAMAIGVGAGVVVAAAVASLRGAELGRLRSNRPLRAVLGHLRGERRAGRHEADGDA